MLETDAAFVLDPNNIDSYIACEYFSYYMKNKLKAIVIKDKPSSDKKCLLDNLISFFQKQRVLGVSNVQFLNELPDATYMVVICDSSLKIISNALRDNKYIKMLVSSGGYLALQDNIKSNKEILQTYKLRAIGREGKTRINVPQSYTSPIFNSDIYSTIRVLKSSDDDIFRIHLVGENILRDKANTESGKLWAEDELAQHLFKKYNRSGSMVNHLITSQFALSVQSQLKKLKPVLKTVEAFPDCIDNINEYSTEWFTDTKKTKFRKCVITSSTFINE